jgi:hypothetical protein
MYRGVAERFVPRSEFDCLLFIDTAHPPHYLYGPLTSTVTRLPGGSESFTLSTFMPNATSAPVNATLINGRTPARNPSGPSLANSHREDTNESRARTSFLE